MTTGANHHVRGAIIINGTNPGLPADNLRLILILKYQVPPTVGKLESVHIRSIDTKSGRCGDIQR